MGRDLWPDLSVQISRRRWRCVVDPHLCLSYQGAALISGLMHHAEIWLGSEFLSILDDALLYDREPDLLARSHLGLQRPEEIRQALRIWSPMRDEVGQTGARLHWVCDPLRESSLPAGVTETVVQRWEVLAQALDERIANAEEARGSMVGGPMVAAVRDTASLAGVLTGSVVLSLRGPAELPLFCRHLEAWRVPCRRLGLNDDLVVLERGLLLHLLVNSGLAGFLWNGLRLAVLHLVVPAHIPLPHGQASTFPGDDPFYLTEEARHSISGPWDDARAFWYDLTTEDPYAATG